MTEGQLQVALDRPDAHLQTLGDLLRRRSLNRNAAKHFARPLRKLS